MALAPSDGQAIPASSAPPVTQAPTAIPASQDTTCITQRASLAVQSEPIVSLAPLMGPAPHAKSASRAPPALSAMLDTSIIVQSAIQDTTPTQEGSAVHAPSSALTAASAATESLAPPAQLDTLAPHAGPARSDITTQPLRPH